MVGPIFYHFNNVQPINRVVLVGCGGTGSQWASAICRILYDLGERGLHVPSLHLVDPDRVEPKNVGRQMFTPAEVGRYKAEVLARRFNLSLGLNIDWSVEAFSASKHADDNTLLCGAVDNHLARRELAKAKCLWIDAGNFKSEGQVVVGNTRNKKDIRASYMGKGLRMGRHLPNAAMLFPALLQADPDEANRPVLSCAELVAAGEQHLLINTLVASAAAHYTYKLLNHEPITTFLTFIGGESLSMRSLPICPEELAEYIH
jgi:PRTRC genetic system ThiF family protein